MSWVVLFCRCGVGLLFLVAGVMKAMDPIGFLSDVEGYRLIDGWMAVAVAFVLPFLEIGTGAALLSRRLYLGSALCAGTMAATFLVALTQAWIRGLDINCGCFGNGAGLAGYPWWVVRDVAILAGCVVCWFDAARPAAAGLEGV